MDKNMPKTILITGANRGIGLGIIKKIIFCKKFNYKIILCSRTIEKGQIALNDISTQLAAYKYDYSNSDIIYNNLDSNNVKIDINSDNFKFNDSTNEANNNKTLLDNLLSNVYIEQLDITNKNSIENLIKILKQKYSGKIDCLVNNAGVHSFNYDIESFNYIIGTNFNSTVLFTEKLLENNIIPLGGKIIIISSGTGKLSNINNKLILKKFLEPNIDINRLFEISNLVKISIQDGTYDEDKESFPNKLYNLSKILINKYTYILGHRDDILKKNIQIYACTPGWVRTDMGGKTATKSIEEGVVTPCMLIEKDYEVDKQFQGKFFEDEKLCEIDDVDL